MIQRKKIRKRAPSLNSTLWISILSISKDLLTNAINFARTITSINKKVIDTIMHSRKSLLCSNNEIQVKKDNPNFDINARIFDGTKVFAKHPTK